MEEHLEAYRKKDMMELVLAGKGLRVSSPHMDEFRHILERYGPERDYLETGWTQVIVTGEDVRLWKKNRQEEYLKRGKEFALSDPQCEFIVLYQKILNHLILDRIIFLHGSLLEVDGKGYLFAAPSGTGKSTHARLWVERYGSRVRIINDDKPLIRLMPDGSLLACGSPWNGKHGLGCNRSVPLKAIVRLRRGKTNTIEKLGRTEALKLLYLQTIHFEETEKTQALLEVMGTAMERVRFYDLRCNMDPEAAEISHDRLTADEEGSKEEQE